jgi:hypothetical protein
MRTAGVSLGGRIRPAVLVRPLSVMILMMIREMMMIVVVVVVRVSLLMMMRMMMMMAIISAVTGTLIIRCCVRTGRIVHDGAGRDRREGTPRALIDQIVAAAATNTVELIRIVAWLLLLVVRKTRLAGVHAVVVVAPLVWG